MHSLECPDSPIIEWMQVFHDLFRRHTGSDYMTSRRAPHFGDDHDLVPGLGLEVREAGQGRPHPKAVLTQ